LIFSGTKEVTIITKPEKHACTHRKLEQDKREYVCPTCTHDTRDSLQLLGPGSDQNLCLMHAAKPKRYRLFAFPVTRKLLPHCRFYLCICTTGITSM